MAQPWEFSMGDAVYVFIGGKRQRNTVLDVESGGMFVQPFVLLDNGTTLEFKASPDGGHKWFIRGRESIGEVIIELVPS